MNEPMNDIELILHPETIMDRPYRTTHMDGRKFKPLLSKLDEVRLEENCLYARNKLGEALTLQVLSDQVLRIRVSPDPSCHQPSVTEKLELINTASCNADYSFSQKEGSIRVHTPHLRFQYDLNKHDFEFQSAERVSLLKSLFGGVRFSEEPAEWSGNRFLATFDFCNETVFGLGGRTMPPARNGQTMDFFNMKVGRHIGDYGGFSMPFYLSTKGYGLFLNNPWPHLYFDMGKSVDEQWFMVSPGGEFDLFVIYGPEFDAIMEAFTAMVGRIPTPDKAVLGFWCSSLTFVEDKQVIETVDRLHSQGCPCDVVVLDGPWRGGKNFVTQYSTGKQYPSNDMSWHADFGDGPKMIQELKKRNVRTSLHINSRNFHPKTAEVGLQKGLLRQHDQEIVVNLSEPAAVLYYESLLEPRIEEGVDIWWTDHADRVSGDLTEQLPSRNLFGSLWNRLICELMYRHGRTSHLCLTRGGGIGSQKYSLPWPGDTLNGIEAFKEDIWFCINAGLAGFPICSADLGGFTLRKHPDDYDGPEQIREEIFDDENICRRLCQSLFFIPSPRIHNNWDCAPKLPWNCSQRAARLYEQMLRIRYELTPYIYSCAVHAAQTGEPIIRPMVYHHRNDPKTYGLSEQFYLGQELIVAPVTEKNAISRSVYLPAGTWVNFWTNELVEGPKEVCVDTPLYEPQGLPVFVKRGAVLSRQPFELTLHKEPPRQLMLDIYPDQEGTQRIHESESVTTTVTHTKQKGVLSVQCNNMTAIDRSYHFSVHFVVNDVEITCDGRPLQYDREGDICRFTVPIKSATEAHIILRSQRAAANM